jgi:hypothetical protein
MILNLIVSPLSLSPSGQHYQARLNGIVVCRSRTPLLSAARVLLEVGYAPDTILTMTHAGSDTVSLRATLGSAAKLAVVENSREGPRFDRYQPRPDEAPQSAVCVPRGSTVEARWGALR